MSWLGNGFREESQALADAYAQMYAPKEEQQEEEKVEQEELSEADMTGAPSIKNAKPAKKTNVKLYPGLGIAPTVKEETIEEEKKDKKKGRCWTGYKPTPGKEPYSPGSCQKEEQLLQSMADAYEMMYEKKKSGSDKCGEGTYWDKEEKKCKSKKKSGGGGRAIFYGGHSHSHDDDDKEDDGGSDAGAMGDAAGGGGGGE